MPAAYVKNNRYLVIGSLCVYPNGYRVMKWREQLRGEWVYLLLRGLTNSPCRIIIFRTADTFIVNIITANTIIVVINVTVSLLLDSLSFAFFL